MNHARPMAEYRRSQRVRDAAYIVACTAAFYALIGAALWYVIH